eukprot:gene22582-30847_t
MASLSPDLDQKYRATSIFTPFDRPRFPERVDNDNPSKTDLEFPNLSYTSPFSSSISVEIDVPNTVISSSNYKVHGKSLTSSRKLSSASTTVAATTTKRRSTHGLGDVGIIDVHLHRSVMMSPQDDDEVFDDIDHLDGDDNFSSGYSASRLQRFQDVRCELRSTGGHNLTSVLMNPRGSLLEEVFDDFYLEQASPVDLTPSSSALLSISRSSSHHPSTHLSSTSSSHKKRIQTPSLHSAEGTSSSHSSSKHGAASASSKHGGFNATFTLTKTESDQLSSFIDHMRKLFATYLTLHPPHSSSSTSSSSTHTSAEELRLCYHEVPDLFFRPDFSLTVPQTFAVVCGSGGKISNKSLSTYLDMVEVALLKQIWTRSPAFFRTLDDIKGLQGQVQSTIVHVQSLRSRLSSVSVGATALPASIPKLYRRHRHSFTVHEKLSCMQQVLQAKQSIAALIEWALSWTGSMNWSVRSCATDSYLLPYAGRQEDDIDGAEMAHKIALGAISNSNSLLEKLPEISQREKSSSKSSDQIKQLLKCLLTADQFQPALSMYRERLLEALKLIIRTCVLEYLTHFDPGLMMVDDYGYGDDDATGGSGDTGTDNAPDSTAGGASFSQRVREMSADSFLSCLAMCYEHLLLSLSRAELFHRFVESNLLRLSALQATEKQEVTLNSKENGKKSDPDPLKDANMDGIIETLIGVSKGCLSSACELAQRSISQLLTLRKDTTSKQLSIDKVKFLWEISLHFSTSVEQLSGATAYIMRQCLLSQTKAFLEHMHESAKGRLVNTLDNERWVQCDVSSERQQEIDRLAGGKTLILDSPSADSLLPPNASVPIGSSSAKSSRTREPQPVRVDSAGEFRVCWSCLLLCEVSLTYLDVASCFPPVTAEVISKTVGLLRLYDNRAKQLVLGAQAIQSAARLKSISAKHLAITSQSLGLIIALLPHMRAALLAQIPPKHHMLLTELDRVSHELIEHHSQIVAKFVSIVGDFVDASATKLKLVDWDRSQNTSTLNGSNGNSNSEYFEEVQRNVMALHRVLQALLPAEQLQDVFFRIFSLLNRKVPQHFEETMPSTPTGRQRITDEVTHLVLALSRLKHVDSAILQSLEETFKRKYMR